MYVTFRSHHWMFVGRGLAPAEVAMIFSEILLYHVCDFPPEESHQSPPRTGAGFPIRSDRARDNESAFRQSAERNVVRLIRPRIPPIPPASDSTPTRSSRAMSERSVTRSGACRERSVSAFVRSPLARQAAHITAHDLAELDSERVAVWRKPVYPEAFARSSPKSERGEDRRSRLRKP